MPGEFFTIVGAVLATLGGAIAAVATAIRLRWEAADRLERKIQAHEAAQSAAATDPAEAELPKLPVYSTEDLKAFLALEREAKRDPTQYQRKHVPGDLTSSIFEIRVPSPALLRTQKMARMARRWLRLRRSERAARALFIIGVIALLTGRLRDH